MSSTTQLMRVALPTYCDSAQRPYSCQLNHRCAHTREVAARASARERATATRSFGLTTVCGQLLQLFKRARVGHNQERLPPQQRRLRADRG